MTGTATGRETDVEDVAEVRAASGLPLLVGSGVTPHNAADLYAAGADGLIVGSYLKKGGVWSNAIDPKRCRDMVRARDRFRLSRAKGRA